MGSKVKIIQVIMMFPKNQGPLYNRYRWCISHCSWKPQIDGQKNAETSSMDFYTQLVTLKGWKKQFENLWADF